MYKLLSIFLLLFFLFNSSFVSEIVQETYGNDYAISPSIIQPRIEKNGSVREKMAYYSFNYPEEDVKSAEWLKKYRDENKPIFVDAGPSARILYSYGGVEIPSITGEARIFYIAPNSDGLNLDRNSYIYLRKINYVDGIMRIDYWVKKEYDYWDTSEIYPNLDIIRNKIYCNGGAVVFE